MNSPPSSRTRRAANFPLQPPFPTPLEASQLHPLPMEFYAPTADQVASLLLGHLLLRWMDTPEGKVLCGGPIVETEAYLVDDPACHAYVRQTPRNKTMWGQEGRAYVFRIYGAYHCVNAVCRPPGAAEAVLIRAIRPTFGIETMQNLRPDEPIAALTNGPGKLCRALHIERDLDGVDLCDSQSPLWIAQNPHSKYFEEHFGPVITTTRIGLTRGVELPLRFYLDGDQWVSKRVPKAKSSQAVPESKE